MAVTHTNRRGETYHLLHGRTKTGKPKYYVSKKPGPNTVDEVPEGFELFENPVDAIVQVRKIRPTSILLEERDEAIRVIERVTGKKTFYVLRESNALVVYWPDQNFNVIDELFGYSAPMQAFRSAFIEQQLTSTHRTSAVLKFELSNTSERKFVASRMCFRGEGFWLTVSRSMPLPALVESLSSHLGKESFYEIGL